LKKQFLLLALILFSCKEVSENNKEVSTEISSESVSVQQDSVVSLAYLKATAEKYTFETGVLDSGDLVTVVKGMLGAQGFQELKDRFGVTVPIRIEENLFWVTGCMPHECSYDDAAIWADTYTNEVWIGIRTKGESVSFTNTEQVSPPQILTDWMKRPYISPSELPE